MVMCVGWSCLSWWLLTSFLHTGLISVHWPLSRTQPATCAAHVHVLHGLQSYIDTVLTKTSTFEDVELWRLRVRLSLVLKAVDSVNESVDDLVNDSVNTAIVADVENARYGCNTMQRIRL